MKSAWLGWGATSLLVVVFVELGLGVSTVRALGRPRGGRQGELRARSRRVLPGFVWIEPGLLWWGGVVRALLPQQATNGRERGVLAWQKKQLWGAGQPGGLCPEEYLFLTLVSSMGVAGVAWLFAPIEFGWPWIGALAGVGGVLPQLRLQALFADRLREAAREMPRAMDLIALCLSAGLDFPAAIAVLVEKERGTLAEELRYLLRSLDMGITRRAALLTLLERLPAPEVRDFTRAILQAEEKGASVGEALLAQAVMSRQRRSVQAEEAAARASVLLIVPLMLLLTCILILLVGPLVVGGVGF